MVKYSKLVPLFLFRTLCQIQVIIFQTIVLPLFTNSNHCWPARDKYEKHASLSVRIVNDKVKKILNAETRCQCYKTFYGGKLRIFRISQSFCSLQASPAQSRPGGLFTTLHFLRNLRISPISQSVTQHQAGKSYQ